MSTRKSFQIRPFDMSRLGDNKVCVFLGKRNTGKSFCVKDMLYYKKDVPAVRVISGTEKANKHYGNFVPPAFIDYEFSDDILLNFVQRQKNLKERSTTEYKISKMDKRAILILDDLMFDASTWVKNKQVREIAMNGRHWDISFIITLQYCLGIPPSMRTNVDYVFIFREPRQSERRKIYEYWAGIIPTYKMFEEILDACTENYGCLVIDNAARSNKLEDNIYYYRASDHEPFKMCHHTAWSLSVNQSRDNYETPVSKKYSIQLV
jgi:hypothetical protein